MQRCFLCPRSKQIHSKPHAYRHNLYAICRRPFNVDKMVMSVFCSPFIESELLHWSTESGASAWGIKINWATLWEWAKGSSVWAFMFPLSLLSESLGRLRLFSQTPSSHCMLISSYSHQDAGSASHGGALKGTECPQPFNHLFPKQMYLRHF